MHFVLHYCKKLLRALCFWVIVNACGIDVEDFAPEYFFRGANISDPGQKFIEIVPTAASFQSFIIKCEALDQIFFQPLSSPDAELGASVRADPISH